MVADVAVGVELGGGWIGCRGCRNQNRGERLGVAREEGFRKENGKKEGRKERRAEEEEGEEKARSGKRGSGRTCRGNGSVSLYSV